VNRQPFAFEHVADFWKCLAKAWQTQTVSVVLLFLLNMPIMLLSSTLSRTL
jgi:hypothetical protein